MDELLWEGLFWVSILLAIGGTVMLIIHGIGVLAERWLERLLRD